MRVQIALYLKRQEPEGELEIVTKVWSVNEVSIRGRGEGGPQELFFEEGET